jgi:amino acid transporter
MLGASRLGYAMAADGLLPHPLASIHERFRTPHVALIAQAVVAIALTFVDQIANLISFAVFNLAFSFLLCSLALLRLHGAAAGPLSLSRRALPFFGAAIAGGLLLATSNSDKAIGGLTLVAGVLIYFAAAPGRTLPHALARLTDAERALMRLERRRMRFLGGLIGWLGGRRTPP